jgi:integrase
MGYGEKVPSPKGAYYRGRFPGPDGKYLSVKDEAGAVVRFKNKTDARKAANDAESDIRNARWRALHADGMTFGKWSNTWFAAQRLARNTMNRYKRDLEGHLLPRFQDKPLAAILPADIDAWYNGQLDEGYARSTAGARRALLHTILSDAVPQLIPYNPATRRRGRGMRTGPPDDQDHDGGGEGGKVITGPLGALLIAERMAILSGRDDELAMGLALFYTGMRDGEVIGWEVSQFRLSRMRVQWQLAQVDGHLYRTPPKAGSRRDIDLPPFLADLISAHIARTAPRPCECHGKAYVFRGLGRKRGSARGVTVADVAREAGASAATVSRVLAGDARVREAARLAVLGAVAALGYEAGAPPAQVAAHWWRGKLEEHFTAAASGKWPAREVKGRGYPRRPVPLAGDWPGTRLLGRAASRAEWCWVPVAEGMTPHGMRHAHKSHMAQHRIPEVMSEGRLGHRLPGLAGVYSHPTPEMRAELTAMLQAAFEESLDARLALSPRSPVAALDALLRSRAAASPPLSPRDSPGPVPGVLDMTGRRQRKASPGA